MGFCAELYVSITMDEPVDEEKFKALLAFWSRA